MNPFDKSMTRGDRLASAAAWLAIGILVIFGAYRVTAQVRVDSVMNGHYSVTVDGVSTGERFTRQDKANAAATAAAINNPDALVRILPPEGWTVSVSGLDPVDPVEPPDPVDPIEPGEGFTDFEIDADHIKLPAGSTFDDFQSALATGKDILFEAGATYRFANNPQLSSGGNEDNWLVIGVYGDGPRPVIECPQFLSAVDASYVAVLGLDLLNPTRNPDNPTFNFNAPEHDAIKLLRGCTHWLIEDCRIQWFAKGIAAEDHYGSNDKRLGTHDLTIRRSIIRYNWNKGDRGCAIYTYRVRNVVVEECVLDHNGWHPDIAADRSGPLYPRGNQAHGGYFSGFYSGDNRDRGDEFKIQFHRNIVSRSSAWGCQFRLGADCTDNVFVQNPYGFHTRVNKSTVFRNAILDGTHIDNDPNEDDGFWQAGWGIQILVGGEYRDNVIANVTERVSGSHAIVYEASAQVHDNVLYNWRSSSAQPFGSVWNKNNLDPSGFAGNVDTVGGGTSATLTDEQIKEQCLRERNAWDKTYDAAVISEQLRGAYQ